VRNVITRYGFDPEDVEHVLMYPGSYISTILDNADLYGPYDSNMDIQNAMYIQLRYMFTKELDVDAMADFYHDIREVTGNSIKYFAVDSRLFPFSGSQTGIFYAPAKLSDHRMIENMPEDFFVIRAETNQGSFYPHEIPIGARVTDVRIEYKDMFYESMLYKTFIGYSPMDAGEEQNVGIPGISGELEEQPPIQAWNLSHFRVSYRTAYYNPYPSDEVSNHTEAWTAINFKDAIELQLKINAGEAEGVVDPSHASSLYNGVIILEYYDGAYVNGTVTVDGVSPLSGAWITVRDELQAVHYLTTTDSEGKYHALAPFGEISVQVSVGSLQPLTNLGETELNSIKFNVTDDQAMRKPIDADKDGILDYIITQDIEVEGGSLEGAVYLDRNFNTEYDEEEQVFPNAILTFDHTAVNETWEIHTDDNGTYNLEGAFPGDYEVTLQAEGRLLGLETVTVEREKELKKDINVTATSIIGIVYTKEQELAVNATANIYDELNKTTIETRTDSEGKFGFENLLPGEMNLEIFTEDQSTLPIRVVLVMEENVTANVTLSPFGTISGRTFAGGKTAPYTYIEFRSRSTAPRDRTIWSDKYGSYSISLQEGWHEVYCVYNTGGERYAYLGSVEVKSNRETILDIPMEPSVRITGTVFFKGDTRNETSVFLEGDKGIFVVQTTGAADYTAYLPRGDYSIRAYGRVEGVYSSQVTLTEETEHDVMLEEERRVAGFVFYDMDGSGDRQSEEGLRDALLTYTNRDGDKLTFLTSGGGEYEAWLIPDEDYSLNLEAKGFDTITRPLSSIDDLENEVVFSLTPKNITVSGQLTLNGAPLVQDNLDIELRSIGGGSISTQTRSSNGAYSVSLRPGSYRAIIDQNISVSGDL
ncbi:MAG: carboxypeptidase regulatory-like domain-containing protein, partial [Thermoplasmata archaeon]|nr:carboxypeptidase regulatory-like domain-containing protein [Thermoplasmata archaeon]